jgi:hypothetical protein
LWGERWVHQADLSPPPNPSVRLELAILCKSPAGGRGGFTGRCRRGGWVTREIIRTTEAPATPATYSQAVKAAGLVFVSGTSPHDPATGKIAGETIQEQTRQCLKNIAAILTAAGSSLERW